MGIALFLELVAFAERELVMGDQDRTAIGAVVETYFRALRASDADGIRSAFHERAQVMGAPEGNEHFGSRAEFEEFVAAQPAPEAVDEPDAMSYEIRDLTESSAFVCARVPYQGIVCIDYLLLAKHARGWRIVAKVFHREA